MDANGTVTQGVRNRTPGRAFSADWQGGFRFPVPGSRFILHLKEATAVNRKYFTPDMAWSTPYMV
ncbi:MAG: hypothetical protein JXN62_11095 [Bacteroidales bacterium]|nr:hypothetical protein [Bacteroidales bacterium]